MKRSSLKPKKSWKKLNPISKKRQKDQKIYKDLMEDYMKQHPYCERCLKNGKFVRSTENHHKKGRGIYYLVVEYFCALCSPCHVLMKTQAKQMMREGWIIDRIGI